MKTEFIKQKTSSINLTKMAFLFVLLSVVGVSQSWADGTTASYWAYVSNRTGACNLGECNTFPMGGLNNTTWGGTVNSWNDEDGMGWTYDGSAITGMKMILMSLYKTTQIVPAYTKRVITWNYQHRMTTTYHTHVSGVYFFETENAATSYYADLTIEDNGNGKHKQTTTGATHSWDVPTTLTLDNKNASSENTFSRYLLLTDVMFAGNNENTHTWAGFRSSSWVETNYYYKHITFNANGGTGSMAVQSIENSGNLTANAFANGGLNFLGWNTEADGTGTAYADGAAITATSSDKGPVTLYAQWGVCKNTTSNIEYASVSAAIGAANNNETIQMLGNSTENVTIPDGKTVTLDLNGKVLSATSGTVITNNGTLTLTDAVGGGNITGGAKGVEQNGTLTVGGKLNITGNTANLYLPANKTIAVSSTTPLINSANIGVTTLNPPTTDSPVAITDASGEGYANYFTSDNAAYLAMNIGQPVQLVVTSCYYVSATGNDSNPGTESEPFKTIEHAFSVINYAGTVKLLSDITMDGDNTALVEGGAHVTLDFNGKMVSMTTQKENHFVFGYAGDGGSLTFNDSASGGGITVSSSCTGDDKVCYIVYCYYNCDLTVNGGTFKVTCDKVRARLFYKWGNGTWTFNGGTFIAESNTNWTGFLYHQEYQEASGKTIVNAGTFIVDAKGWYGYGIYNYDNGENIEIHGGDWDISGTGGMYAFACGGGTMDIDGGTFKATCNGDYVYGVSSWGNGVLTIAGGKFEVTNTSGEYAATVASFNPSKCVIKGTPEFVPAKCTNPEGWSCAVETEGYLDFSAYTGSTLDALNAYKHVYNEGEENEFVAIPHVTGDMSKIDAVNSWIEAGYYSTRPYDATVQKGMLPVVNEDASTKADYPWTIGNAVAEVGPGSGKYYTTLASAIAAAENGQTIKMLANSTENVEIPNGKTVTLDLDGKVLSATNGTVITNNGTLTLTDSKGGGNITGGEKGVEQNGTLTVGGMLNITGNTANLYLPEEKTVTVSTATPLITGASIGVTTVTAPTASAPVAVTGTNSADYSGFFTSDNLAYSVKNIDNQVNIAVRLSCYYVSASGNDSNLGTASAPLKTLQAAYNKAVGAGLKEATIALLSDIDAPAGTTQVLTVSNGMNIKVVSAKANGDLLDNAEGDYEGVYRIRRGNNVSTLVFLRGGNLTLEQIIFDGQAKSFRPTVADPIGMGGSGYFITAEGKSEVLAMGRNAVLRDNINIDETNFNIAGSAVVLGNTNSGNATMYMRSNAKIIGCEAPRHGGALTIYKASCHMSDRSEMSYNGVNYHSGIYYGGAAVLAYSGALYVSGDAVITKNFTQLNGNTVSKARSAVYLDNYGYVKDNARIFDNYDNGKLTRNNDGSYTLEGLKQANAYGAAGRFYVNGAMGPNAMVGVTVTGTITVGSTVVATGSSYTVTSDDADRFFDDRNVYKVAKNNNTLVFAAPEAVSMTLGEISSTELHATFSQEIAVSTEDFVLFKDDVKMEGGYTATVSGAEVTLTFSPELALGDMIGVSVFKNGYIVNSGNVVKKLYTDHHHCICGEDTGTHEGHDPETGWKPWTSTNSLPDKAGNYYLADDVTLTAAYQPVNGVNMCLNGHVVKQTASGQRVIDIASGVTFKLTDCDKTTEHNFKVGSDGLWTLTNDAKTVDYESLNARPETNAVVAVKGGVITGGVLNNCGGAIANYGTFEMYCGNIIGNTANMNHGGGLCSSGSSAVFKMYGGRFCGNYTTRNGGGICGNGGAMSFESNSVATIYDGEIMFNAADRWGGGIFLRQSNLTIAGGTFSYNLAQNCGGGMMDCDESCTLTITGGTISNNKAQNGASGAIAFESGTINMGGNPVITNNADKDGVSNLRLYNKIINVVSGGFNNALIGVTTATAPTPSTPVQITAKSDADYSGHFTSDNANYNIRNAGNKVFLTSNNTEIAEDPTSSYKPTQIVNGSFDQAPWMTFTANDNVTYTSYHKFDGKKIFAANKVFNGVNGGWNTTEEYYWITGLFEYRNADNTNVYNPSITGTGYIEMNCWNAAVCYQDLSTQGKDVIRWTLNHAVVTYSDNVQSMRVEIGEPMRDGGGAIINASGIGNAVNSKINDDSKAIYRNNGVTDHSGQTSTIGFAGSNIANLSLANSIQSDGWYQASGVYVVPEGQGVTRFAFISEAPTPNEGNLLDDITFSTLIGNLHANLDDYGNVIIIGYWGDADATKKLCVKVGETVNEIDMSSVLNMNFKITFPKETIGDATEVEIYHEDYKQAKRTVKIDPYKQVTNFDPKFGTCTFTLGINAGADAAIFTDNGQNVQNGTHAINENEPFTVKIGKGFKYYDGTLYDMYVKITPRTTSSATTWKYSINDNLFSLYHGDINTYKDFDYEIWLQEVGTNTKVDDVTLVGGSCYMAPSEGVRPYSDDGYIYTNIPNPANVWAWNDEHKAWVSNSSSYDQAQYYIIGHGVSADNSLKSGYYATKGYAEFVVGYMTKNVTFRAEFADGSTPTDVTFSYTNPAMFSGNVLKVPVDKAIGTLPTVNPSTVTHWYVGDDKATTYTSEQLSQLKVKSDMTVTAVMPAVCVNTTTNKQYATVQNGVNAAASGQTIKMIANSTENVSIAEGKDIILDLNGKTITSACEKNVITNMGTLTVTDGSEGNGCITGATTDDVAGIANGGELYLYAGNVTGNTNGVGFVFGTLTLGGKVKITDNTTANLYLLENQVFSVGTGDNAPAPGMMVGVTPYKWESGSVITVSTANGTNDYSNYFKSDKENFVVYADKEDGYKLKVTDDVKIILTADPEGIAEVKIYNANTGEEIKDPEHIHYGTMVTIKATSAKQGYAFKGWYHADGTMFSGKYEHTFKATENLNLTAKFTDAVIWVRVKKGN